MNRKRYIGQAKGIVGKRGGSTMKKIMDAIIIGGGIAGLQAAIQLGRYKHEVLVIDKEDGRSTLCKRYHNILGYPNGISGQELRQLGKQQAEELGVQFLYDMVVSIHQTQGYFTIHTEKDSFSARKLLIATGVKDNIPPFDALYPCLGISVFLCPDCDGYEVKDKKTIVIGNGNVGANMALTLSYWTEELIFINHGGEGLSKETKTELDEKSILFIDKKIREVNAEGSQLKGYILEDGKQIEGEFSFLAFGGNKVNTDLAKQLGVKILDNQHIKVDARTKMTSVDGIWAAGDVVAHSEQVTIALGDGSQAAIWMHKALMKK